MGIDIGGIVSIWNASRVLDVISGILSGMNSQGQNVGQGRGNGIDSEAALSAAFAANRLGCAVDVYDPDQTTIDY